MSLPDLALSFGGSVLILLLLLCIAIIATVLFYRTTIPPIPRGKRLFLATLRGFALALLLALLFEPLLKLLHREEQDPVLAVLIDASESMNIRDQAAERSALVRRFLEKNSFSPFLPRYYHFSSRLNRVTSLQPDSLRFDGEMTDIAAALSQMQEFRSNENIQAAVLISDGVYTVGRNPITVADNLGIPLYTIGVGDTLEQRDILIANVATNNIVYAETRVPVDVRVRGSGFRNEKVDVTLTQGGSVLDRKVLQLQEATREYSVGLSYEPKEEGTQKYTVTVSSLPGELTEKNNVQSFFVKVLKTKLRILLIAGAPSPDVSTVRQTLSEEEHFTVKTLVQKRPGEFYEGSLTQAMLDSADCFVLIGFPSAAASPSHLQLISNTIERRKKPLLFIASKTLDFAKLPTLEAVLPFSWSAPNMQELLVFGEVPERQRSNVLVQRNGEVTLESWQQLPPIFKTQTVFRAKPEADALALAKIQSVVLNEPLVLTRSVARQKSFAITGHGIWRWRLPAQGNPRTERFLSLLLTNAVRWLTTADEGKRVRVVPTKEAFTTAEPVEFTGEVYDEQLRPVENVELRVSVNSKEQNAETILRSIGSGRYEGSVEGLGAGDYTFGARATLGGTTLGEDKGRFSVGQMNVEFLETKMNKQLLEQLAYRSGAFYADIGNAASLIDSIRARVEFTPKEIVHTSEVELWNWQYLMGLLVLLLAAEWFVRKRSGML
jgi:hypothetical protein